MATTLTPTPPIRFCINRLRQSIAEASRFSDEDLLDLINEGYRSACERAQALQSVATITFPAGTLEAALPVDWSQTIRVYQAGRPLDPIPYRHASAQLAGTYYQYDGIVGVSIGDPEVETSAVMLYARSPVNLFYDDTPQWGPEWNYLLRHYTAWRCVLAAGGAQTVGKAVRERQLYEAGVRRLRHQNRRGAYAQSSRIRSVLDTRRTPVAS